MEDNIITLKFEDVEVPKFSERIGDKYLKFGDKDDYPDFLVSLLNKSAKHGSIVKNKVTYILGGGLKAVTEDATAEQFIAKYKKLSHKIVFDIEAFGMSYIECIPTRDGKGWSYYHLGYKRMRINNDASLFYYKKDKKVWDSQEVCMPAFNPTVKVRSCFMFAEYNPESDVYGLPGYLRCVNYILADVEVSKHTLSNAKTGFSPSKFINFFNGEPSEPVKRSIENRFKNKFGGSAGEKMIIGFNNVGTTAPTIQDLGASDLTKEDFNQVDQLISNNIYAGHEITNPALFGVPPSNHSLGGSAGAELKMSYDIFKNTYVSNKKDQAEQIFNFLAKSAGIVSDLRLIDIEPVGYNFSEATLLQVAPKSWLLEQLGIDATKYPDAAVQPSAQGAGAPVGTETMVNDNIKNLTAKQHQQLTRIIRQFIKGQITKEVATILLKTGLGLSDEDINGILGVDNTNEQFGSDEDVAGLFAAHGEPADSFVRFDKQVATFKENTDIQDRVATAIKESPTATPAEIAKKLKVDVKVVNDVINGTSGGSIIGKKPKFEVRYSYEKRADVTGPEVLPTTRPFCKKLLTLNRLYTRADIQQISGYLGYDVMKRAGGFWNNNGTVEYHCRHEFYSQIVIRK